MMYRQRESALNSLSAVLTLFDTADIGIHLWLAHAQLLTVKTVENAKSAHSVVDKPRRNLRPKNTSRRENEIQNTETQRYRNNNEINASKSCE